MRAAPPPPPPRPASSPTPMGCSREALWPRTGLRLARGRRGAVPAQGTGLQRLHGLRKGQKVLETQVCIPATRGIAVSSCDGYLTSL